jgi:ABC-type glutathione transport system ATPase component
MAEARNDGVLLSVQDVKKHLTITRGSRDTAQWAVGTLPVVDGVTFEVRRGETLAIAGAPGSGKSTLARLVVQLVPPTAGRILYDGKPLAELRGAAMRDFRRRVQIVFQDPYAALSPRLSVGQIIAEPMDVHRLHTGAARAARVAELLEVVGLNRFYESRSPLEFSGAQRQRIAIARALSLSPEFLVWDEPGSRLDPAAALGLRNLLKTLRHHLKLTCLLLTSDVDEAREMGDRVLTLQAGRITH